MVTEIPPSSSARSSSSSSADSYIGSLISLTSKSEIRYEGILYNINTEESSIGLRNVRSYGTEGRKKDGPQVLPSDKIYEYILFRGSDIKDLQVKSSPPAQAAQPITDPAIIQSHYPRPPSSTAIPPIDNSSSSADISSHASQLGHPPSTFQGGLPLYQSTGNIGSWGPSPPQNASGSGLLPMYWPGYYGPPNGLPQMHQQSLFRPPGLTMPPPMQYPNFNASVPSGTSNLLEYPSSLLSSTTSSNLASTSFASLTLSSSLPPVPPVLFSTEPLPNAMPNKTVSSVRPTSQLNGSLTSVSSVMTTTPEVKAIAPPITNKSNVASSSAAPYQGISHSMSSTVVSSSVQSESHTPSLVTPEQLLQSVPTTVVSSIPSQAILDVEVVKDVPKQPSEPLAPVPTPKDVQPPILPLPTQSSMAQKGNGPPYQNRQPYGGRERGRGTGTSRPATRFTEEFDFTAMNEKFNKNEVWGHLGKSCKSSSKEKADEYPDDEDYEDEEAELPQINVKPVYSKDDFFDTLSCNDQTNNGRIRFSEQMKLDTETFGEFSRHRGGWGGRGPYRGGRYRGGSYYGRGYGYAGRGRGGRTSYRNY